VPPADEGVIEPTRRVNEIRLRKARSKADLDLMRGKLAEPTDYDLLLTGPTRVLKPDRTPLCVYLPGELTDLITEPVYDVLHSMRKEMTDNRGDASGTERIVRGDQKRTRSSLVASALVGSVGPGGIYPYCRLTSWTARNLEAWPTLWPLLRAISLSMATHVRDRWQAQAEVVRQIDPAWVIPGTVFTTVTVNNTYSTGYHLDDGDLRAGFSTLLCVRRGSFSGGELVFPKWRVGVDMRDGDLLLLDAGEMHGNTRMVGEGERITVVAYVRENMTSCGTVEEELAKAQAYADRRTGVSPAGA
jgi:hypothetical protein